ncbi:AfsR/SARP family transcriptional regulator [Nocardioides sp. B-3]|uniref:AfsR/SARP family transcriptional regulator n=1 Tax=Nocardioides sp. B-3 TaxID=2895565 RepID=UPI002152D75B|nr:bacterial transcriptional activator domain-containing protein [Nocardioides sp. B-3]UUZ61248.1 bacterial transcriptional activator domain-containing protein [Nocardioides sp. B-3]
MHVDVDDLRAAIDATGKDPEPGEARTLLAAPAGEELLPGWYAEWLISEREDLAQSRVRALMRIARFAMEERDPALAVDAARVASAAEPLPEQAREVAISAHLQCGDRASALREFATYRDVLRDELGVAPSGAVVGLVRTPDAPGSPNAADRQTRSGPCPRRAAPAPARRRTGHDAPGPGTGRGAGDDRTGHGAGDPRHPGRARPPAGLGGGRAPRGGGAGGVGSRARVGCRGRRRLPAGAGRRACRQPARQGRPGTPGRGPVE